MATAKEIKKSLIQQLQAKGADVPLYCSKIDEYIDGKKIIDRGTPEQVERIKKAIRATR